MFQCLVYGLCGIEYCVDCEFVMNAWIYCHAYLCRSWILLVNVVGLNLVQEWLDGMLWILDYDQASWGFVIVPFKCVIFVVWNELCNWNG